MIRERFKKRAAAIPLAFFGKRLENFYHSFTFYQKTPWRNNGPTRFRPRLPGSSATDLSIDNPLDFRYFSPKASKNNVVFGPGRMRESRRGTMLT
ncbi:MAG: hypothetical protein ACE5G9_12145 [Nitrospinales bacterium]